MLGIGHLEVLYNNARNDLTNLLLYILSSRSVIQHCRFVERQPFSFRPSLSFSYSFCLETPTPHSCSVGFCKPANIRFFVVPPHHYSKPARHSLSDCNVWILTFLCSHGLTHHTRKFNILCR